MGKNLQQVYTDNPASDVQDTDIFYLIRSPYAETDDMGVLASTLKAYTSSSSGAFTPTFSFNGDAVGMEGTFVGFYVKNGFQVDVQITITLSNKGSSTGNAEIGNFPFTGSVTAGTQKWMPLFLQNCSSTGTTYTTFAALMASGDNSAAIYNFPQNALTAQPLDNTKFQNDSIIILTGTYWTAS